MQEQKYVFDYFVITWQERVFITEIFTHKVLPAKMAGHCTTKVNATYTWHRKTFYLDTKMKIIQKYEGGMKVLAMASSMEFSHFNHT